MHFASNPNPVPVSNEDQTIALSHLVAALTEHFPIDFTKACFNLYPFSNEGYFAEALTVLKQSKPMPSETLKLALLVGESNFISMLPELLAIGSKGIVLTDIEPLLHSHTKHLLTCLLQSPTPEEFILNYGNNNPIIGKVSKDSENHFWSRDLLIKTMTDKKTKGDSLKEYFFLINAERYAQCREAANKLQFIHINFNLFNQEQCQQFMSILKTENAALSLVNLTNLHHYDTHSQLKQNVARLLEDSPDCFLMYAGQDIACLNSNITQNAEDYFNLKTTYTVEVEIDDCDVDIQDEVLIQNSSKIQQLTNQPSDAGTLLTSRHGFHASKTVIKQDSDIGPGAPCPSDHELQ